MSPKLLQYVTLKFPDNCIPVRTDRRMCHVRRCRCARRCGLLWRWVYDSDWTDLRKAVPAVNYLTILLVGRRLKQHAVSQGMGRQSREEVMSIAEEDLRALSAFLGERAPMFSSFPLFFHFYYTMYFIFSAGMML